MVSAAARELKEVLERRGVVGIIMTRRMLSTYDEGRP